MARITLDQLISLVESTLPWQAEGYEPPKTVLYLELPRPTPTPTTPMDVTLAGKTLSYEGATITVNLDFDASGYLTGIEFV